MPPPVLAILGGSFNPPHLGHALIPGYLRLRGLAARILVAPCWSHAFAKSLAPFDDRLAWTRAAMADAGPWVEVSAIEARLAAHRGGGPSYTIDLLEALTVEHPGYALRPVIGSDIVVRGELARWHRSAELQERFPPIVIPRGGYAPPESCALPEVSSTAIRAWLADPEAPGARESLEATIPAAALRLVLHGIPEDIQDSGKSTEHSTKQEMGATDHSFSRFEAYSPQQSTYNPTKMGSPTPSSRSVIKESPTSHHLWLLGRGHVHSHVEPWLHARGWTTRSFGARALVAGEIALRRLPGEPIPAGMWLLCRDPALPPVAQAVAQAIADPLADPELAALPSGLPVLHAAGALIARSAAALATLAAAGHPVATLHPICSLRREHHPGLLDQATFGVEGDPAARRLALALLGDQPWLDLQGLDPPQRRAYHGGCALAANHLAVLWADATAALSSQNLPKSAAAAALAALLWSSLTNLLALGIPAGITGPATRGDQATIDGHLAALEGPPLALYQLLHRRLAAILDATRGNLVLK